MAFEGVRYRCLSATIADSSISDTFAVEHTSFIVAGRSDGQSGCCSLFKSIHSTFHGIHYLVFAIADDLKRNNLWQRQHASHSLLSGPADFVVNGSWWSSGGLLSSDAPCGGPLSTPCASFCHRTCQSLTDNGVLVLGVCLCEYLSLLINWNNHRSIHETDLTHLFCSLCDLI